MQPPENEYQPINNDFNNNNNDYNNVNDNDLPTEPVINTQPPQIQTANPVPPPVQAAQPIFPPQQAAYPPQQPAYPPQQPAYLPQQQVVYQPVVQPVYGQHIIVAQPQPVVSGAIIVNQNQPLLGAPVFSVSPVLMVCPFCQQQITTRVVTNCNIGALCLFLCITYFYFIIQCIRGKDCCCNDAIHYCPNCGHELGRYYCF